jgi:6-phosphogluconolactonase
MSGLGKSELTSPPVFHAHGDVGQWVAAAVADTIAALRNDLDKTGRARLLVSGGTTPGPVYRALAKQPFDWAKVEIALVDERWLPGGDPGINAHLIRESLLTDHAAAARFQPMITSNRNLDEAVRAANDAAAPASVALLGMGPDGHTASLFPRMRGLADALASAADYVEVDASGCPGAGPWSRRISLTPAGLAKTAVRILLIRGEQKRVVVQRALEGADPGELPIRMVFSLPGAPLQVHWCP